ncbi:ATP-binding cassette domain-containing protein [Luteimonas sp. 100069]|nr:ATP-binding cassette domain-containing protein [Luteimonas sp. 100069]
MGAANADLPGDGGKQNVPGQNAESEEVRPKIDVDRSRPRYKVLDLARLAPFITEHRALLVGWLLTLFASTGAMLSIPAAIRRVVDTGFEEASQINPAFTALLGVALFLAAATGLRFYCIVLLGERAIAGLRRHFYAHLIHLDQAFFDRRTSGELISRLTADTELVRSVLSASLPVAARNAVMLFGSVGLLLATSPRLTIITLVCIPLCVAPLLIGGKLLGQASTASQDRIAESNAVAVETLAEIRTVRAYARETWEVRRFSSALGSAVEAARSRVALQGGLTGVGMAAVFGTLITVLWIGAHDVGAGRITAGELSQFMLYAFFAGTAVAALGEVWADLQRAAGGMSRLSEILDERECVREPTVPTTPSLDVREGLDISIENVSFAYPTRPDASVLKDLSVRVSAGETVAIVGPSGAGKSTLLSLLLRFYDPDDGRVMIDGVDIRSVASSNLRGRTALVSQHPGIFADTIRENIRYGRLDASDDEVRRAADLAHVSEFALAFPRGLDEVIGERGAKLSGGQQQRVAIARALLRDAPILLLDEATSALDSQSERVVQEAFETLRKGRTTVIIAHRLATVIKADRIVVLDSGRVVAQGTHCELIERGGLYADLAKMQLLN